MATLNLGSDEQLECYGYRSNPNKRYLYYCLTILSAGILSLLTYWYPQWYCHLTMSRCPLKKADCLLLKDTSQQYHIEYVRRLVLNTDDIPLTDLGVKTESEYTVRAAEQQNGGDVKHDIVGDEYAPLLQSEISGDTKQKKIQYFDHHHIRYVWENDAYAQLVAFDANTKCSSIHDEYKGYNAATQSYRLQKFGSNSMEVPVKSYGVLFVQEVLNPFYIFQVLSVVLWFSDEYYFYAACIVLISAGSIGVSLYETKRQNQMIHDMAASIHAEIPVKRADNSYWVVSVHNIVPGDVIAIPANGCLMPCDAVLIEGTCIVNESMLTGESVPVSKTSLTVQSEDELYAPDTHKYCTLFAGTKVMQTRYYGSSKVTAVVIKTGFSTAKGELVRSILFPKPMGFKFYRDAMKFILFLSVVAAFGMVYSIIILIQNNTYAYKIILRTLDIITIAVPPALPAAMTVATVYAQNRLKKRQIFCISPPRINYGGKLKLVCFDKTGTLTEDGLDLFGVQGIADNKFERIQHNVGELPRGPFMISMAVCHSLTVIGGEIVGEPLEIIMFKSINWTLDEPGKDTSRFDTITPTIVRPCTKDMYSVDTEYQTPFEVGILRQFPFSSANQRMGVIVRVLGSDHMDFYIKGSPEKIVSFCENKTVPDDTFSVLSRLTEEGLRVIALAWRPLSPKLSWHHAQKISRSELEVNLTFLGFLILKNTLKRETTPVIDELQAANIRCVMVTGDNIETAISVARECHMIRSHDRVILVTAEPPLRADDSNIVYTSHTPHSDQTSEHIISISSPQYHFAVTGKSFGILANFYPHELNKILVRGVVFARMSPDQKAQLVEKLQNLGFTVGMCGDGANDCGALKMAHVGISLSDLEASVAAPFTSKVPDIRCVPSVIKEGRAALVTSFGSFKYMALYSLIQFCSVLILYTYETNLSDFMFLYVDLFITATVAILMGRSGAYHRLVAQRPPGSLMKFTNLMSILFQVFVIIVFQIAGLFYLRAQPVSLVNSTLSSDDYMCAAQRHNTTSAADNYDCYETTMIFLISAFQYIIVAFCFSKGPPYRKRIWTNVWYLASLVILTCLNVVLVLFPFGFLSYILQLVPITNMKFKLTVLAFAGANFLMCYIIEYLTTENSRVQWCFNRLRNKSRAKNEYKRIEKSLAGQPYWPPLAGNEFQSNHNSHTDSESAAASEINPKDATKTRTRDRLKSPQQGRQQRRDSGEGSGDDVTLFQKGDKSVLVDIAS